MYIQIKVMEHSKLYLDRCSSVLWSHHSAFNSLSPQYRAEQSTINASKSVSVFWI